MELKEIGTWLLPAICGVALKLSIEKTLNKERVIRAIIQGSCIGYFANELCIIKEWIPQRVLVAGASAFLVEYILQFILKFKFQILKQTLFRVLGVTIPDKNENN